MKNKGKLIKASTLDKLHSNCFYMLLCTWILWSYSQIYLVPSRVSYRSYVVGHG